MLIFMLYVEYIKCFSGFRKIEDLIVSGRRMKTVQFADGIKPGEGTSPSAGEELSSPPPPKNKLPKEKRYKKTKFHKKTAKKKVKVSRIFATNIIYIFYNF